MSKAHMRDLPDVLVFTGNEILSDFDFAAERYGEDVQQAVLELEFQVRRSDGTWVPIDLERVRIATRGMKKDV